MPQPASPAPTPLAPQPKPGLLSQLGHYITSPEGLLTIGTTLRAGGGDKEAFQDQARILNRMDEQRALGRKTAQQDAANKAFWGAYQDDPDAPGFKKLDEGKYQTLLQQYGFKGDIAAQMAGVKSLRDDQQEVLKGERGGLDLVDKRTHKVTPIRAAGPEHTDFDPKHVYLMPDDPNDATPPMRVPPPAAAGLGTETRTTTGDTVPPPPPPPPDLVQQPVTGGPGAGAAPTPAPRPAAAQTLVNHTPQDAEALAQMMVREAADQGQQGMAAVGSVALNRLRTGYGGAKSLYDVIHAPAQFTGMSRTDPIDPKALAQARVVAQQLLTGQGADPTGGAVNYINKDLQLANGAPIPAWAQGQGQKIGAHTFFGGHPGTQLPLAGSAGTDSLQPQAPPQAQPPAQLSGGRYPIPAGYDPPPKGYHYFLPGQGKDDPDNPELPAAWTGLTGDELLKVMPASMATQVKALSEGRMAFPSGYALTKPYWQRMMNAVGQFDPSFDQANPAARVAARKDITSGTSSKTITSANTTIGHLFSFDKAIDQLPNVSGFYGANMINKLQRWSAGSQANTSAYRAFEDSRNALSSELTRLFRGSGGSEADVERWMQRFDEADGKASLHKTTRDLTDLIHSRLDSVAHTYNEAMGTTKDPYEFLRPENQKLFDQLSKAGEGTRQPEAAPAPAAAPGGGQGWSPFVGAGAVTPPRGAVASSHTAPPAGAKVIHYDNAGRVVQ
jgi:hypothetical protein